MVLLNLLNGIKNTIMSNSKEYNLAIKKSKLAVIGLGYVGLPLAIEFGKKRSVIGFDINKKRVDELKNGLDSGFEVSNREFKQSLNLIYTNNIDDIKNCEIFIVTIPTPIDDKNKPDLTLLHKCCDMIGSFIKTGDLVIFESTVYPGATEEVCVPIIEKKSGLTFNKDFFCGYSPERINPGDKGHRISTIMKVTSGSTPEISIKVDELYKEIITAGTHKAPNEFSVIFNKLNINTKSVLDAAGTKWNFLPFKPGLVGGHCIGVDPYYLAYKSLEVGHNPVMITAGRKINDGMALYVGDQVKKFMIKKDINLLHANILIMGLTFKENCPDIRNTKIVDLINTISKFSSNIDVYDPWADKNDVKNEYGIDLIDHLIEDKYDTIVLAVAHDEFKKLSLKRIKSLGKKKHIIYDLKNLFNIEEVDLRL